jgi:hypothetical protein
LHFQHRFTRTVFFIATFLTVAVLVAVHIVVFTNFLSKGIPTKRTKDVKEQ